jgi:hypothetical protein
MKHKFAQFFVCLNIKNLFIRFTWSHLHLFCPVFAIVNLLWKQNDVFLKFKLLVHFYNLRHVTGTCQTFAVHIANNNIQYNSSVFVYSFMSNDGSIWLLQPGKPPSHWLLPKKGPHSSLPPPPPTPAPLPLVVSSTLRMQ